MDLNDLPFRVVCCSKHQTASITTDDGAQVNVQQNGDIFSVLVMRDGAIVVRETSIGADRAQELVKDL